MCVPYFPDYKSRFFSCHGGESTYTPVRPMCRQIHGNHWATACIPVGSIDGTEPCVMRAQRRPNYHALRHHWPMPISCHFFAISEVAADWHGPMVPQRIMWPSIPTLTDSCTHGAASRHTIGQSATLGLHYLCVYFLICKR